jgi:hypothetical protein
MKTVCLSLLLSLNFASSRVLNIHSSQADQLKNQLEAWGHGQSAILKKIKQGEIVVESEVKSLDNDQIQSLSFYILGIHPRSCVRALSKISRYEIYHQWLPFLKASEYREKQGRVHFVLDSKLLPTAMVLNFKIPRITRPGTFPFSFDQGFLKGLKGEIEVVKMGRLCVFHTTAKWRGKHSGIPSLAFELFTETLSSKAMSLIFRKTKI